LVWKFLGGLFYVIVNGLHSINESGISISDSKINCCSCSDLPKFFLLLAFRYYFSQLVKNALGLLKIA